jgi:hypothetical protein
MHAYIKGKSVTQVTKKSKPFHLNDYFRNFHQNISFKWLFLKFSSKTSHDFSYYKNNRNYLMYFIIFALFSLYDIDYFEKIKNIALSLFL